MVLSAQRPRVLLDAVRGGRAPVADLPELTAFAWLHDDSPTSDVSESDWKLVFKSAGFFSYPPGRSRSAVAIEVFRGTTDDRLRRMSWADERDVARQLGRRHAWYGPAALYSATIEPDGVLAYLARAGEGWTVVVDTTRIEHLQPLERLPDPRPAVQLTCN
jgi:hypothetical protein